MIATDYTSTTTCGSCVAVVDNHPPKAIEACQTSATTILPVDYTTEALQTAILLETAFSEFYSDDNVIDNGEYDLGTGGNDRCDEQNFLVQPFFSSE